MNLYLFPDLLVYLPLFSLLSLSDNSRKSEIYQSSGGHLPLMSSRKNNHSWLPHIYVILIGVSLGGALMFSLIFIGAYYYISLRNTFPSTVPATATAPSSTQGDSNSKAKFFHSTSEDAHSRASTPPFPPQAHSSPKRSGDSSINGKRSFEKQQQQQQRCDVEGATATSENGFMSATSRFFSKYRARNSDRESSNTQHPLHNNKEQSPLSSSKNKSRDRSNNRRNKKIVDDNSSEIEIDINSLR